MSKYSDIRKSVPTKYGSRCKYADGGVVSNERKGGKTVINIITPQAPPAPAMAPAAPPMGNSPSPAGAPPVPPAAMGMALDKMQGKPGAPGAFANGGLANKTGGAESGSGRLANARLNRKDGGGVLTAKKRKALPKSDFGQPGTRKYPMPDKSHAANAKARASQAVNAGRMSKSTEAKIDAKADRKLGKK